MTEDQVLKLLPAPKRRSAVRDPEFGEIVELEYDGLIVELDKVDGGLVVGALAVVPKSQ